MVAKINFTPAQSKRMHEMQREGKSYTDIAKALGISRTTVRIHLDGPYKRTAPSVLPTSIHRTLLEDANHVVVPPGALAEREHRYGLVPRDLTAAFFGDPLPGYSALERRC